ncbi:hypothetical protein R1flu_004162 [Riccia fluitans]|uniref:Uncharacterized protein n=1 Tax=Riccia fluitans TaxID=41844 RepID=A0ABD1YPS6_9MARC
MGSSEDNRSRALLPDLAAPSLEADALETFEDGSTTSNTSASASVSNQARPKPSHHLRELRALGLSWTQEPARRRAAAVRRIERHEFLQRAAKFQKRRSRRSADEVDNYTAGPSGIPNSLLRWKDPVTRGLPDLRGFEDDISKYFDDPCTDATTTSSSAGDRPLSPANEVKIQGNLSGQDRVETSKDICCVFKETVAKVSSLEIMSPDPPDKGLQNAILKFNAQSGKLGPSDKSKGKG